jgi:hypothetical protein
MIKLALTALAAVLFAAAQPAIAAQPPTAPTTADNPEMWTIFDADQAPRGDTGATVDWSIVAPQDEARRAQTRRLLASGALKPPMITIMLQSSSSTARPPTTSCSPTRSP